MLLSSLLSLALAQSATAAIMTVTVAANNKFQFTPNTITAQPGDMVAFNFVSQNHSVASSNANTPCQPQQNAIFSDFQPVAGPSGAATGKGKGKGKGKKGKAAKAAANRVRQAGGNTPTFMVPITDTQPMYIYCSQAQHCQQGMVMVINPVSSSDVTNYAIAAAQANNNISPRGGLSGGSVINNAAGTNPSSVLGANLGDAATTTTTTTRKGKGKKGKGKAAGGAGGGLLAALTGN